MSNPHVSPGALVLADMEQRGWTQSDLAFALGITTAAVNQILGDKRGISPNMARALSAAFNRPTEYYVAAQAMWDAQNAEPPDAAISARARILAKYPLRDMIKRGWISADQDSHKLEQQVCDFFGVSTLDEVPHLSHSAKKTANISYEEIPAPQLAWLFRVKKIAEEMVVPAYNREYFLNAIEEMSRLRDDVANVRKVPRILSNAGVRFVVVESLPGSKIDGVCFWLNENSPVIGLSLRFDRIDNFWFVLRHECAHVIHGHGKAKPIVDNEVTEDSSNQLNDEEKIANSDAADFCVPKARLESFYLRKKPLFPDREVVAFSKMVNVHPGLVVGQLQRKLGRYDLLRQHLVKVRDHLASAMMFDGWGDVMPTSV